MIRRLRFRLVAAAMLSLFTVLLIIMTAVNFWNYRSIAERADGTLALLASNEGRFPMRGEKPFGGRAPLSPELPYMSRFFSVLLDPNGQVLFTDIAQVAAVNATTAERMAKEVLASDRENGFLGGYRYLRSQDLVGERIIFLDCNMDIQTFRTFLVASCFISFAGFCAVFLLIVLVSGRIVRPVSESYEKQKRFITDAGHEIKTPVTIIDADAEVLEMDIGKNEWLQDIRKQTKRLSVLTNDLIYLSRMEERQIPLQRIDFPLSDLVSETAHSFQAIAVKRNLRFSVAIEPLLTLNGDEKAIRQLITVLLDNALKYADENGEIRVSLKKQGRTVCLTVFNTTDVLKKEEVAFLFDRFYRADRSRNSQRGGYGIGLSIAKAIVSAHRGKISATSPDGHSLTVSVSLNLVQN